MSKSLINERARTQAYEAWGRILKLANDLERVSPGAGDLFLRQMAKTLDQLRDEQLCKLRTSHEREARPA